MAVVDYGEEFFSEHDDYVSFDDDLASGSDDLRPGIAALGLSRHYIPYWTRRDAFREFYQNWYATPSVTGSRLIVLRKDAIIASFNIEPRDFHPVLKESKTQIEICVHRPESAEQSTSSPQLLGYILYKKKAGSVEITNFKAELKREYLLFGETTKRGEERFAGTHGEGFKVAALVMRRNEHAVRFASKSYYWNFRFSSKDDYTFVCALSEARPETVQRKAEEAARRSLAGIPRGLIANIWEDVTVSLKKARGNYGQKISEADFRSWLGVTLDIDGPEGAGIVRSSAGDLILDQRYSGRTYLKGIWVPGQDRSKDGYVFAYNFHTGQIDRDRYQMGSAREEAEMVAKIWECAITDRGPDVIDRYIQLFRENDRCKDVNMAEEYSTHYVAQSVWTRLRSAFPLAFFYPGHADAEDETSVQVRMTSQEAD